MEGVIPLSFVAPVSAPQYVINTSNVWTTLVLEDPAALELRRIQREKIAKQKLDIHLKNKKILFCWRTNVKVFLSLLELTDIAALATS